MSKLKVALDHIDALSELLDEAYCDLDNALKECRELNKKLYAATSGLEMRVREYEHQIGMQAFQEAMIVLSKENYVQKHQELTKELISHVYGRVNR